MGKRIQGVAVEGADNIPLVFAKGLYLVIGYDIFTFYTVWLVQSIGFWKFLLIPGHESACCVTYIPALL